MKKKVVYILSDLDYALAFEWLLNHFDTEKYDLQFILIESSTEPTTLENLIGERGIPVHKVVAPAGNKVGTLLHVTRILLRIRPTAVHCHMRRSNVFGLTSAWLLRVPERIYTRHYSTQNHRYFPHAVKTDRVLNRLATKIVAPSETVRRALTETEGAPKEKVVLIHHGFELDYFKTVPSTRVERLRSKYHLDDHTPVVGVISRYLELKGWDYIIPAFEFLLRDFPDAILLISNATGPYSDHVKNMLSRLPKKAYREITFERDLAALYACMDCFVHAPIDEEIEAFGQIYIEALAAGVPSVFTLSGIACDTVVDGDNALVVDHQNSEQITAALVKLLHDKALRNRLIDNGYRTVAPFGFEAFMNKTQALYG